MLREIRDRLRFLVSVGLDYLSLDRKSPTLSGGEAQRIRLASQIGSGLTGVLYVLDEPTIGLHPRDNARLLQALHHLRDLGNTLLLVEHDREVIRSADYVLDFGPGAGHTGGEVTASGSPKQIQGSKKSLTGQYLSGKEAIPIPTNRRIHFTDNALSVSDNGVSVSVNAMSLTADDVKSYSPVEKVISIVGARQHNLHNIDVHIPLGAFIAVTGVSGSGKSSLINEVLFNTVSRRLHRTQTTGAVHDDIVGLEAIGKIISVDQDPLGNSPSSNPATYTGVFDLIRELFSRLPESKVRGYPPRRFSFNQKGGRCEACEGNGQKKIEMHFLPDVWVECETCKGQRYNPETLAVRYHGHSIADVLAMSIREALELFGNLTKIRTILQTLDDVGLGYMALGQSAPTMSGGEAQRVKLAAELARPSNGDTLYLLDEPTTGLHFDDVKKLLDVLQRLADLGNTVIVVEHNLDVIKSVDWIIDMGPEAGRGGGFVVAQGTPESVALQAKKQQGTARHSYTGLILADVLADGPYAERTIFDPRKAALANLEGVEIAEVGKEQQLPWEEDGERWHTQDRVTTRGEECTWDGEALREVVAEISNQPPFREAKWNHRSVVEIGLKASSTTWFLHAYTSYAKYLTLKFRLPKPTFKQDLLRQSLKLKPLQDIPGLESASAEQRVTVKRNRSAQQDVTILIVSVDDIRSPGFQQFLEQAIGTIRKVSDNASKSNVDAAMPWNIDGPAWHHGDKGFPPGKKRKWPASILTTMLKLVESVAPDAEISFNVRDAITVRVPGIGRMWARFKTKEPSALECWFISQPGQFTLGQWESIGIEPGIDSDRNDGSDIVKLKFTAASQLPKDKMEPLLKAHLEGFRTTFGE